MVPLRRHGQLSSRPAPLPAESPGRNPRRWVGPFGRWWLILFGLVCLSACGPREPIRIGFIGGLSGRVADLGEDGLRGARFAVEQTNAAGGIDGRKVHLEVRDDAQDAANAAREFAALAATGVDAVIGPLTSSMAVALVPASEKAGIVMVSPTVTARRFFGIDDKFFVVATSTEVDARRSAEFHFARGTRRVGALFDLANAAYTKDWLLAFGERFKVLGGVVVGEVPFTSGEDLGYRHAVRTLKESSPDALLLVANAVDTVRLLHLARDEDLRGPVIGVTWAATERLVELGGRIVEGLTVTQFFDREDRSERYAAFRTAFVARFGSAPGFASVAAYDATRALIQALARRKPDQSVKDALLSSGPYEGVQQTWNFNRFGDAQMASIVTEVRGGRFIVIQ